MQDVTMVSKLVSYLLIFALGLTPGVLINVTTAAKNDAAKALKMKTLTYGKWNRALIGGAK